MKYRRPAVAGTFYPQSADALRRTLIESFAAAVPAAVHQPTPKAIVVPHAGYIYSGPIAASAYNTIRAGHESIRRVVLLGPCHREYVRGMAVPSVDAFATPLGLVPIDDAARRAVSGLPAVEINDRAHAAEHSLEVQLPFLQTVLDDFTLVPIAVGDATTDEVADVLHAVWGGPETLIVISTDLSHYHPYADAVAIDARTAAAVTNRRPEDIADRDACGARPLRGLLAVASELELDVDQLDLRNSADTAGDRHRVVGYGAFCVG